MSTLPDWQYRILGEGEDPDPRFTLANERTFLAWIRTAMALVAAGVAVEALTQTVFTETVRTALAASLLVLGILLAAGSFVRWVKVERSLRRRRSLPVPLIAPLLAGGVAVVTAVLAIWLIAA
ncbi:YidH family protein [Nesterenkonia populi]|uniref:YidH family protein n=1 Tax=Nesterenkonia populi TaxID=1591087 RepID=UPI0011BF117F|nr:DUF202 domain-containing protein [Nesterenkonia populi]